MRTVPSSVDRLDGFDWLPTPTIEFQLAGQMQLARIRQANCITFTRDLAGLDTLPDEPSAPQTSSAVAFQRAQAVQAGVVTNADDANRAMAFFAAYGFRSRTIGYPGLGTRIYVRKLARSATSTGSWPSRNKPDS